MLLASGAVLWMWLEEGSPMAVRWLWSDPGHDAFGLPRREPMSHQTLFHTLTPILNAPDARHPHAYQDRECTASRIPADATAIDAATRAEPAMP